MGLDMENHRRQVRSLVKPGQAYQLGFPQESWLATQCILSHVDLRPLHQRASGHAAGRIAGTPGHPHSLTLLLLPQLGPRSQNSLVAASVSLSRKADGATHRHQPWPEGAMRLSCAGAPREAAWRTGHHLLSCGAAGTLLGLPRPVFTRALAPGSCATLRLCHGADLHTERATIRLGRIVQR